MFDLAMRKALKMAERDADEFAAVAALAKGLKPTRWEAFLSLGMPSSYLDYVTNISSDRDENGQVILKISTIPTEAAFLEVRKLVKKRLKISFMERGSMHSTSEWGDCYIRLVSDDFAAS